jgi:acetoin utilization protein AcuB
MSTDLVSIESDAPLAAAAHLLVEHRLRRLPVTHEGRLVGIITRSDVLGAIERRETGVIAATSTP